MGKKVRKKSRGSANEKRIVTHSTKKVMQSCNPTVESADDGVSVVKEIKSCPHLEKSVNLDKLSSKIGSSKPIRCEDCREGAADRRGSKRKVKHGKKKGGASVDAKSESKGLWFCLECGQYSCGGVGLPVTPQCHAVRHARQNRHPLVVHFEKPQLCWCFPCNMLIPVEKIEETDETNCVLYDVVKLFKGRSSEQSSVDVEDVWFGDGSVTSNIKSGVLLACDSSGKGGYIVRGMVNLGNTCFFNSIMQNLLAMNRLRDSFLELDAPVGPLICSLMKLFADTNPELGSKNVINPRSFFGCICSKYPQFHGYQQHDSHELLCCLLDGLGTEQLAVKKQNDSPRKDRTSSNMTTLVDALFGGQICSTVCCVECGHSSTVYEPFLDLSLPVPTKKPSPRKARQVSRSKKPLPPKKGGKTRGKVNRDADRLPVQSLSTKLPVYESSCPVPSGISVATEAVASSGDSKILKSADISNMVDKEDTTSSNSPAVQGSEHLLVLGNATEQISISLDDFTWLDYVESETLTDEHDFSSEKKGLPVIQDTGSKDDTLNKFPVQASCESSGQVCFFNEEQNLRTSSLGNGWEDDVPLQVQGSEVLLLPYKEEGSSTGEIMGGHGEASSSVLGCGQEESEFDGFGDLFNEPEIVAGPPPRPSSSSEVMEAGFIAGNSSESDADEVDDTNSPVSVESCLAHFTKPELLSNENAWHCENCTKILQRHKLEAKKQAKATSMGINGYETGSHDDLWHAANSCPAIARSHVNGDTKNDEFGESSLTCVKNCSELENGRTDELSAIVIKREDGVSNISDTHNDKLQSSGFRKACNEESCNSMAADPNSTQHMIKNVQRDPQLLHDGNNDSSEENKDEEVDSNSVKVKRDATKRVLIYKAPPILTIHLKRFSQDARGRMSKLNGHVNFRDTINLRPYLDPRCINEEKYEYCLVGVVEHLGTMRGGHYVAYVRGGQRNGGNPDNEGSTWYHASDAYVREVSLDEVLRCEAYILFYEKS